MQSRKNHSIWIVINVFCFASFVTACVCSHVLQYYFPYEKIDVMLIKLLNIATHIIITTFWQEAQ